MKPIMTAVTVFFMFTITAINTFAASKIEQPADCQLCGMKRTIFTYSRALVEYTDGTKSGTCSINCAMTDIKKNHGKKIKSIKVADFGTKKLINATTAFWVIGGDVDGVMTPVAKWAFARQIDAQLFVKEHGGWVAPFKEVQQAVNEELEMKENDGGHQQHNHNH